ncbi:sensor histidine kinase [Cohnella lubricantis]|uniref:histidine kinase n=1 Tax=Cohnella lubricantis TaxID=2163172 RepID=A0A841TEN2_9BACL|nr:sensor histidine kinase [Cohnella lubricantis]MBB6679734.1 sensor histidine kinase [Cohnella lubricantis]MBP2120274.1 two-component system sensor histidine kinase YesM [Cohnella lubricantis]
MVHLAKWFQRAARRLRDFGTRRLVNKLTLLFTTIIILVVACLTLISYWIIQRESIDHTISSNSNNLMLVNQNLEKYFDDIEQLSLPQIKYDDIIHAIKNVDRDYASRIYLEDYLRSLFYSRSDLERIYLYLIDDHKYLYISRENYDVTVRAAIDGTIPDQLWYKQALASDKNRAIQSLVFTADTGYSLPDNNSFMAYHRVLRSLVDRQARAVLSFYVNPSVKDEIMKDVPFEKGEHLLFLNTEGVPFHLDNQNFYFSIRNGGFLSKVSQEASRGRFVWTVKDRRYQVMFNVDDKDGWRLIKLVPYDAITRTAHTASRISILIGLGFLALSILIVTLTSNAITRPLKKLSLQMNLFGTGTFDAETEVKGRDEIAQLSKRFNQMVRRMNELINERYRMKLVEKSAILKALEAEINPHFLYNALQAISTKALKSGEDEVADMVDALAQTLRYCISGKDSVQVRDELKHVERYLTLQKARFGNRLQVVSDIDESLMGLAIPKLSIQSLVENSIKHALEKVVSSITILIRIRLEPEHAVISVKDDGPGIPPDKLREILQSFRTDWEEREGDSIGLKNLNARLQLIFGDEARLEIAADETGTEMRIMIPRGGTYNHVQSSNN